MSNSTRYELYKGDNKKEIGLAYIIVNQKFNGTIYRNRPGAKKDYENMKKLFKPLGFKLYTFMDKSATEIREILSTASQRNDLAEFSCFVCVISSHGEEWSVDQVHDDQTVLQHVIIGSDGEHVATQDIVDLFREGKCSSLAEKPKLFFLQACRENATDSDRRKALDYGDDIYVSKYPKKTQKLRRKPRKSNRDAADARPTNPEDETLSEEMKSSCDKDAIAVGQDSGVNDKEEYSDDETDDYETDTTDDDSEDPYREKKEKKVTQLQESEKTGHDEEDAEKRDYRVNTDRRPLTQITTVAVPCHNDMLVMFASPSGKIAWRDTVEGGWLLANLYNVFKRRILDDTVHEYELLSILTKVSGNVASWETTGGAAMKMIPVIHHQLSKEIFFKIVKTPGLWSKFKKKIAKKGIK